MHSPNCYSDSKQARQKLNAVEFNRECVFSTVCGFSRAQRKTYLKTIRTGVRRRSMVFSFDESKRIWRRGNARLNPNHDGYSRDSCIIVRHHLSENACFIFQPSATMSLSNSDICIFIYTRVCKKSHWNVLLKLFPIRGFYFWIFHSLKFVIFPVKLTYFQVWKYFRNQINFRSFE